MCVTHETTPTPPPEPKRTDVQQAEIDKQIAAWRARNV